MKSYGWRFAMMIVIIIVSIVMAMCTPSPSPSPFPPRRFNGGGPRGYPPTWDINHVDAQAILDAIGRSELEAASMAVVPVKVGEIWVSDTSQLLPIYKFGDDCAVAGNGQVYQDRWNGTWCFDKILFHQSGKLNVNELPDGNQYAVRLYPGKIVSRFIPVDEQWHWIEIDGTDAYILPDVDIANYKELGDGPYLGTCNDAWTRRVMKHGRVMY